MDIANQERQLWGLGIIFSFHHKNFIFKPIKLSNRLYALILSLMYSLPASARICAGSLNMGIGNRPDTILVYVFLFLFFALSCIHMSDDSTQNHSGQML